MLRRTLTVDFANGSSSWWTFFCLGSCSVRERVGSKYYKGYWWFVGGFVSHVIKQLEHSDWLGMRQSAAVVCISSWVSQACVSSKIVFEQIEIESGLHVLFSGRNWCSFWDTRSIPPSKYSASSKQVRNALGQVWGVGFVLVWPLTFMITSNRICIGKPWLWTVVEFRIRALRIGRL